VLIAQVWSLSTTVIQLRIKTQLNTTLFAKTLVRKNIVNTIDDNKGEGKGKGENNGKKKDNKSDGVVCSGGDLLSGTATVSHSAVGTDPALATTMTVGTNGEADTAEATKTGKGQVQVEFSSKAQVMTLMTTDADRVAAVAWHLFALVDTPIEIAIGSYFVYALLGVSAFYGLAATFGTSLFSILSTCRG
jgi:hypothetical protein